MKILIVSSIGYEGGGAEQGIILITRSLRALGHEVRVVTSDLDQTRPHTVSDVEFRACSPRPFWQKFVCRVYNWSACATVRRVLREFNPDIVQVHTTFEVSPAVLLLLRAYPSVLVVHGAEDYTKELLLWGFPTHFFKKGYEMPSYTMLTCEGKMHYWYHRCISIPVYAVALRYVDKVLVVSEYMRTMLKRQGIESVCIPNATVLPEPVPLRRESMVVLYAGRLERLKGVQFLLEAFVQVKEKFPDSRLVVAGTGAYLAVLQELAGTLGVSDVVEWKGHVGQEELQTLYAECALVVVPSIWPEPFGKVGIEAMGVGRAVIASDVGGMREWLDDGVTGYIVPPSDSNLLAEKMLAVLGDAELRETMARNARAQAHKFSIDVFVQALMRLHTQSIVKHNANHRHTSVKGV